MVSLLSFFTGKKKSRRAPSPPPQGGQSVNGTNGRPSPKTRATRFASMKQKSSARSAPYDLPTRRASSELARKRSERKKNATSELPRLALGWELTNGETGPSTLGLEGVGLPARLDDKERQVLQQRLFSTDEVIQGWKIFGKALKESGIETPGIFLPDKPPVDRDNQYLLLALFILSTTASSETSFPSLVSHWPTSLHNDRTTWSTRLADAIGDTTSPSDFVGCLLFLLSRLQVTAQQETPERCILLDTGAYNTFLTSEREANYPITAYDSLFASGMRAHTRTFLEQVFEVMAAVAAHSDANGLSGGSMSRLLGWWLWYPTTPGASLKSWEELYNNWLGAGRRTEHLLHAWIRYQSSKQTLPTKLLQLVEGYPFEVDNDSLFLSAPPSTVERQVLHLTIITDLDAQPKSAKDLIDLVCSKRTPVDANAPKWRSLAGDRFVRDLVDVKHPVSDPEEAASTPKVAQSPSDEGQPEKKDTDYRPFSMLSLSPSSLDISSRHEHYARRSAKTIDLGAPISSKVSDTPLATLTSGSTREQGVLQTPSSDISDWNTFRDAGFGEAPRQELELSPQLLSISPPPTARSIDFGSDTTEKPAVETRMRKQASCAVNRENFVSLNDLFLPFVETIQSFATSDDTVTNFALVRFKEPQRDDGVVLEWLLITSETRPPTSPPKVAPALEARPASPAESTLSKSLGFFRRSSSFGGKTGPRMSIFGGSRSSPKTSPSTFALSTLSESGSNSNSVPEEPNSAISTAPTDYTISDIGALIKVPSSQQPKTTTSEGQLDLSQHTKPSDWVYRAEGKAHLVFTYIGDHALYVDRVLRLRKPTSPGDTHEEAGRIWKEELLPKLIPERLLLLSKNVDLPLLWVKELLETAEQIRPKARKEQSGSLVAALSSDVRGAIMDDSTAMDRSAQANLAIEIKPKWGFLPRAENISPEEAVHIKSRISRYVLHRHYKEEPINDRYDPLDLFASEDERVERALEGLWGIWTSSDGLKNNWRVFLNGKPLKPDQESLIPAGQISDSVSKKTTPLILPVLKESGVLEVLRTLQSTFDAIDISSLAEAYRKEYPDKELFDPESIVEPDADELKAFINKYLADPSQGTILNAWSLRELMVAYAISAIFKDCSIFITLPLSKVGDVYAVMPGAKIKIIDLDLKDVKTLRKWYDLDQAIWENWRDTHPPSIDQSLEKGSPGPPAAATGGSEHVEKDQQGRDLITGDRASNDLPSTPTNGTRHPSIVNALGATSSGQIDNVASDSANIPQTLPTLDSREVELPTPTQMHSQSVQETSHILDLDDEEEGTPKYPSSHSAPEEGRQKRSMAPSPSPTPFQSSLPSDLVDELAREAVRPEYPIEPSEVDDVQTQVTDADQGGTTAYGMPTSEESSNEVVPMLKGDSLGQELLGSGTSTPFETFSTPMTELPEPALSAEATVSSEDEATEMSRIQTVPGQQVGSMRSSDVQPSALEPTSEQNPTDPDASHSLANAGDTSQQLLTTVTSVTGEEIPAARLPDISELNLSQRMEEAPSAVDPTDDLPLVTASNTLALADFAPHSLAPVLERGESKAGILDTPGVLERPALSKVDDYRSEGDIQPEVPLHSGVEEVGSQGAHVVNSVSDPAQSSSAVPHDGHDHNNPPSSHHNEAEESASFPNDDSSLQSPRIAVNDHTL